MELEREIGQMCGLYQEDVQRRDQHTQTMEERLKRTEELLATRSAELSGAHAFLSTMDRLSEAEVLNIVRDLNENIYQVAVNLTEEWEKLESSQVVVVISMDVDPTSRPSVPALVQLVHSRDPAGLTFLFQSCLCSLVVNITSGWGYYRELVILKPVYQRLSASGANETPGTIFDAIVRGDHWAGAAVLRCVSVHDNCVAAVIQVNLKLVQGITHTRVT